MGFVSINANAFSVNSAEEVAFVSMVGYTVSARSVEESTLVSTGRDALNVKSAVEAKSVSMDQYAVSAMIAEEAVFVYWRRKREVSETLYSMTIVLRRNEFSNHDHEGLYGGPDAPSRRNCASPGGNPGGNPGGIARVPPGFPPGKKLIPPGFRS